MPALISFRNEIDENRPNAFQIWNAQPVSGQLSNLYARQLELGVVMPAASGLYATIKGLPQSLAGVRVIGLLGLDLGIYRLSPRGGAYLDIYGVAPNGAQTLVAQLNPYRHPNNDPRHGLINRIAALPSAGEDGLAYNRYLFRWNLQAPLHIGRVWIGNAVQIPRGVDADWAWSVQDPGQVYVSRGGQAYAAPAPRLRALRATISGPGLDARLAFGHGVPDPLDPEAPERRSTDWLSDCALHAGATGNIIVVPRASSADWVNSTAIYGRLQEPIEITHAGGDYYSARLSVIEER